MRTQLKYVIIPTTAVTVSFIREDYHYNLKHNLFARKHPFSTPIQPLRTNQYSPLPILSRCMTARGGSLYLIIIIYLIIYISARVTDTGARVIYIGARRGAGTCTDATMRARNARAAGRPAAVRARRAEGQSGGEYCKKQGGCVGFSDFMFTFARYRGGSGSCQRHLQGRGGTDGGGQTTLQATGTMHQVTGTMHHGHRDHAPGRWDYAPGRWDYAPWWLGLCARSQGARTKDKRYI